MSDVSPSFEALLREALAPVEPPDDLVLAPRGPRCLSITEMAADELEAWELSAMRDPRNWVRPAVAVVAGTAAGGALVLLRARRRIVAYGAKDEAMGARRRSIAPPSRPCAKIVYELLRPDHGLAPKGGARARSRHRPRQNWSVGRPSNPTTEESGRSSAYFRIARE